MNCCEIFSQPLEDGEAKPEYRIILNFSFQYSVREMCLFFEVSRSGYYAWLRRDGSNRDLPLAELIRKYQAEWGKIHGYRYVHLWLARKKQVQHNPKTFLWVMRKYELLSEIRRRKYHSCGESIHRYENLLNHDFRAAGPNFKWVTDISYIRTQQGFLYLSVIRDLFGNSIVADKTSRQQTVTLVLNTIRSAMKKISRQGVAPPQRPRVSITLASVFQEYGIIHYILKRGNPYYNALAEKFLLNLKEGVHLSPENSDF